ncbi:hypothetical protein E4U55_003827 [Claviceps digitariae]|nr:hypothetical protein E4U55_003827 [Claviceps digitariae]
MSILLTDNPIPNAVPVSPMSTTSSKHSRRSLITMANHLKPTRQNFQKYFTKSRHSAPEPVFKDWQSHNLGSVIKMTSLQMGSLANPEVPMSPVVQVQDSRSKPALVRVDTEQQRKQKPALIPEVDSLRLDTGSESETESGLAPPSLPHAPEESAQPQLSSSLATADSSVEAAVASSDQEESLESLSSPSMVVADSSVEATISAPAPEDSAQPPLSPSLAGADPSAEATDPPLRPLSPSSLPLPLPSQTQIAELPLVPDVMSMETDPTERRLRRGPSLIKPRPRSSVRRRAKTPVHKNGHTDMATAVRRQGSVRSIARQYRTLIEDTLIEETDIPEVPRVPSIHRKTPSETATAAQESEPAPAAEVQEFDDNYRPISGHSAVDLPYDAGLFESPRPRSELTPSPVASDADTLVSFHDETAYLAPLLFPAPPTPPFSEEEMEGQEEIDTCDINGDEFSRGPGADGAPFQTAFNLLTRELSMAFADDSARSARDTSSLQVWVMIAAYERLRDQISATDSSDPHLQGARAMFDTWLDSLRAVQKSIADEGADSESEYGDE